MRKRNCAVLVRFSEKEMDKLNRDVERSGLSREGYIRAVIKEKTIKELPPVDFTEVLKELRKIGGNLNQVALKANSLGIVDRSSYSENYEAFQEALGEIIRQVYG